MTRLLEEALEELWTELLAKSQDVLAKLAQDCNDDER
jgi:hypothetical protein